MQGVTVSSSTVHCPSNFGLAVVYHGKAIANQSHHTFNTDVHTHNAVVYPNAVVHMHTVAYSCQLPFEDSTHYSCCSQQQTDDMTRAPLCPVSISMPALGTGLDAILMHQQSMPVLGIVRPMSAAQHSTARSALG